MLYQKMDENNVLTRRVEQLSSQCQQLVLQQQLASLQQANHNSNFASPSLAPTSSSLINQVNLQGLIGAGSSGPAPASAATPNLGFPLHGQNQLSQAQNLTSQHS